MRAADIKLESLFDVLVRGETNTLVGRWASADVMFSVEDSNIVGEERVCMRMCLAYDERGVDEGFFLFRSDGAVLQLDVPAEQLDVLFDAEVTALDDGTQTSNEGGVETNLDVIRYSYAVTNQQGVVEVLNNLLNDSFTLFPRKNNGGTTQESSEEGRNLRANNGEDFIDPGINTVVRAHDQREAVSIFSPEESTSSRSNLTEEESKYLLRKWNFDWNLNNFSDRTAREREYLSRLWNFDSKNGGNVEFRSGDVKKEKWFSLLWNFDLKSWEKIGCGQYILARPPKKPGGRRPEISLVGVWKIFLLIALSNASTKCAADSDQHVWSEPAQKTK